MRMSSYIPDRYPRYHGYVLPLFSPLIEDVNGRMEEIRTFTSRETDILICAYPKSGTNWMNEILVMMMKGSAEYDSVYKRVGMLEMVPDLSTLASVPENSTRVLNTHVLIPDLPQKHIQNGYKVVHIVRNPKDVAVSWYNHMACLKDLISMEKADDFPVSWSHFISHFCRGEEEMYTGWFNYEKSFESAKAKGELRNVFTIHYEQLKQNPLPILRDLAAFLGVKLADDILMDINDKCSFEKMSTLGQQAKDNTVFEKVSVGGKNFYFRKGQIGDWKNWFTVAQNEAFDRLIETEMKDSKLNCTYEQTAL